MVHPDPKGNKLRGEGRGGTKEDDSKKALSVSQTSQSSEITSLLFSRFDNSKGISFSVL